MQVRTIERSHGLTEQCLFRPSLLIYVPPCPHIFTAIVDAHRGLVFRLSCAMYIRS